MGRSQARSGEPATTAAVDDGTADFEAFYRQEWAGLVALAWSLTGQWAVAEELAQDAFGAALRRWPEVGRMDRPGAWVRRAVINRSIDRRRRRASEGRGLVRAGSLAVVSARTGAPIDPTGDTVADRVGDPAFWAAVRALPERQGTCLALHYLEDRSVVDIAAVLGCRPSTVKVHLHRGRTALAAALDPRRTHDQDREVPR